MPLNPDVNEGTESDYLVTFFTHYDAIQCVHLLGAHQVTAHLSPVPRKLSSSCGSCARFHCNAALLDLLPESYEQLARQEGEAYVILRDNR